MSVLYTDSFVLGFHGGSDGKESACSAGNSGLIPGLRRSPAEKGIATYSSILAWRIPKTKEPGGLELNMTEQIGLPWWLGC